MRELTRQMYAHKRQTPSAQTFFWDISSSRKTCEMYTYPEKETVFEVEVSIDPDQSSEEPEKTSGFIQEYWGFVHTGKDEFDMVQPSWPSFEVQFPYGVQAEVDRGRGQAYKLIVREKFGSVSED